MPNRHRNLLACAVLLLFAVPIGVGAQSLRTEHTYRLDEPDNRVPASLEDVSWLAGSWSGEAFGDVFEEVWNPSSAGSMVGMFKLLKGDKVAFYELMLITEEEGSLIFKVKHFHADFTAWEDKQDYVTFRLVKVAEDAVHFSGLSFHRISDDEIHAYLALSGEGKTWEEKLVFKRRK